MASIRALIIASCIIAAVYGKAFVDIKPVIDGALGGTGGLDEAAGVVGKFAEHGESAVGGLGKAAERIHDGASGWGKITGAVGKFAEGGTDAVGGLGKAAEGLHDGADGWGKIAGDVGKAAADGLGAEGIHGGAVGLGKSAVDGLGSNGELGKAGEGLPGGVGGLDNGGAGALSKSGAGGLGELTANPFKAFLQILNIALEGEGVGPILDIVSQFFVRLAICALGSNGVSGHVLPHVGGGKLNPKDLQCHDIPPLAGVEGSGLGGEGVFLGHGPKSRPVDSLDLTKYASILGSDKFDKLAQEFIEKILGGRDISELPAAQAVALNSLQKIDKLLTSQSFSKKDISELVAEIITIVASVLNNSKPGSGDTFVVTCIQLVDPEFTKCGLTPLSSKKDDILRAVKSSSENLGCWTKVAEKIIPGGKGYAEDAENVQTEGGESEGGENATNLTREGEVEVNETESVNKESY